MPKDPSRVLAVLGPTNTGKTHFAVERMLAHPSGLIGFPLRLLAREIFDRIVAIKGAERVALITGEEKIQPKTARYWIATVEAMPEDLDVSFLAVDEIQLAADRERGHVFTDRLLRARGRDETIFLGADTIRPLLKQLVPEAEVITRPRFSTLTYVAPQKVTRLPKRSAVVAFTAKDVYAFAELVRRRRGGAAVVLGSLSPRTRNAQVELYQSGEVDYLIATDAIGMGLNMDLSHVTLAGIVKFDGQETRKLYPQEIGQIAGRAGRHMRDGTFGTSVDVGELEPRLVEAVENHQFPPLSALQWRNADLDLSSMERLSESLNAPAPLAVLKKTGNALDHVSLKMLARRDTVQARSQTPSGVGLLWSVCQIPDFRKTLTDAHLALLETIFCHLADRGRLPTDWVADHIARLERTDGDIDALTTRLAHVRTWTYVTHRADWLDDASHWQARARAVEDRLSDALHERLTQRFVDRRTQAFLKSMQEGGTSGVVETDGTLTVEGEVLGRIDGLLPVLALSGADIERRALNAAARRVIGPEMARRAKALIEAADDAFSLDDQGCICWRSLAQRPPDPVARLLQGATPLAPRLDLIAGDQLSGEARNVLIKRLQTWLDRHLRADMGVLDDLRTAKLEGAGRGIAFLLLEGLGNIGAATVDAQIKDLSKADRQRLSRLGVRFGVRHLYVPAMMKPRAMTLRARLWAIHHYVGEAIVPPPGRVTWPASSLPDGLAPAIGFEVLGAFAVRIDIVERLAAELRQRARDGSFALDPALMALCGLGPDDLQGVVEALGFKANDEGQYRRSRPKSGRSRKKTVRQERQLAASPFAILQSLRFKTP